MNIFKDKEKNIEYFDLGFVKSEFLNTDEVSFILKEILSLKPDDDFFPKYRTSSDYHCTFLDSNEEYKRKANKLFKEFFNPKVNNMFNNYHVWNANFYVKQPGAGKFEMHQNWTHVADEKDTSFTIWCPLVDTNRQNGTLQVVPKSHKIFPDIATLNVPYYFENISNHILNSELETIPVNAGDCVIFEDGVIHFSDINLSNSPRYALQILIGPKNVNTVFYYYNKNENVFEVYEIDDEFFMKNNFTTMFNKPTAHKLLKVIENTNKLVDVDEYNEAIKNGFKRRRKIYGNI